MHEGLQKYKYTHISLCISSLISLKWLVLVLSTTFISPCSEFRSFQNILQNCNIYSEYYPFVKAASHFYLLNSFSLTMLLFKGVLLHLYSAKHSASLAHQTVCIQRCIIHHPHMHMHIPQQKSGQTFCQHSKWLGQ